MFPHIARILEEIYKRNSFAWDLPYTDELITLLKNSTLTEKHLIGQYFCKLEWNIGSIGVLAILQESWVLTATEFILSLNDEEHVQLILNDFLEAKYQLLGNLITSCSLEFINSSRLEEILAECIQRLFKDMLSNPNAIDCRYLNELENIISEENLRTIKLKHFRVALSIDEQNISIAFSNQQKWENEYTKHTNLWRFLEMISSNEVSIVKELFQKAMNPHFKGWKFGLIFLRIIASKCSSECGAVVKNQLKESFKRSLSEENDNLLWSVFILARALCYDKNSNLENYQQWFKFTVGEMKYFYDATNFKKVMNVLTDMLRLENSEYHLNIQSKTAIFAPTLCNDVVLKYKKLCRERLSELGFGHVETEKTSIANDEENDCIIIAHT